MKIDPHPQKRPRGFPKLVRGKKDKRQPWTLKEDNAMRKLVAEYSTKQWTVIATKLNESFSTPKRTGKQCRERWHNHLSPGITKDMWTHEEELLLFSNHEKIGNKWAEISNFLPGRTDNSIKNHFYSTLRKQYRALKGVESTREQLKKHAVKLATTILAELRAKKIEVSKQDFLQVQDEFLDYFPESQYSLPSLEDELGNTECELMVLGHHIELQEELTDIEYDEKHMEWFVSEELPDEVYFLPKFVV